MFDSDGALANFLGTLYFYVSLATPIYINVIYAVVGVFNKTIYEQHLNNIKKSQSL